MKLALPGAAPDAPHDPAPPSQDSRCWRSITRTLECGGPPGSLLRGVATKPPIAGSEAANRRIDRCQKTCGSEDFARGTTKRRRQDVLRMMSHGLPTGPAMCDNVTHEGDLNQGVAPAYRRVGASGPKTWVDSRPRSAHAGRDADARQRGASDQPLRAMETAEAIREGPRPPRRGDARRGHHQP